MKIKELMNTARAQKGILGYNFTQLERLSGVHRISIKKFLYGGRDIYFLQAMAIFEALEVKIEGGLK